MTVLFYTLWAGEIIGLSFIATPAKFLARDLSIPKLLLVGRATFHIQQILETLLLLVLGGILGYRYIRNMPIVSIEWINLAVIAVLYGVQYYLILPLLDERVTLIQGTESLPPSNLHHIYVGIEMGKIACLSYTAYVCMKLS